MITGKKQITVLVAMCFLLTNSVQRAHADREWLTWDGANKMENYGYPIELRGKYIYFTSWKYVKAGQVRWKVEAAASPTSGQILDGDGLQRDGDKPARWVPENMPSGIRLVAQKGEKVPMTAPWTKGFSVVFDEGKYKMWQKASAGDLSGVAYQESQDGTNWVAPKLGLYEKNGNKDNNIVFLAPPKRYWSGGNVFIDPSSKKERFKMIYVSQITKEEWAAFVKKYPGEADSMALRLDIPPVAVWGAVSPDGLNWTALPEPLLIQHADTENICYYDVDLKKYVAVLRSWVANRVSKKAPWTDTWMNIGRRSIALAFSDDFRHFGKAETYVTTGADMHPAHVYYTNCKTTLPGAPDNHVMFPWLWEMEQETGDTHLLSSPDSLNWSKVPGGPVAVRGPVGSPDGAMVLTHPNLLEYGDHWGIPYSGTPIPHKYPGRNFELRKGLFPGVKGVAGMVMWPKGRLVALQADGEGEFSTVDLFPPAKRIRLNAVVEPTGYITVTTTVGRTNASDRLVGDSLAMPVTWNGESELKNGDSAVSLNLRMKQAKLFAVEFY